MTSVDVAAFSALGWEARVVLGALRDVQPADGPRRWLGRLPGAGSCLVVQTGVGPDRAAEAVLGAPAGAAILSIGCGGGLVPWLRTGDVVVATEVVRLDGSCRPAARITVACPTLDVTVETGGIASSARVLGSAAEKTAAAGCGAVLVDMESWVLAAEAARRGVRFAAVRVVLDAAGDRLPDFGGALDMATGDIDGWRAARALLLRPWMLPGAVRLARQQGEAAERLGEVVAGVLRDPARLRAPRAGHGG